MLSQMILLIDKSDRNIIIIIYSTKRVIPFKDSMSLYSFYQYLKMKSFNEKRI